MVDWNSPAELGRDAYIMVNMMSVCVGCFFIDSLYSFRFDFDLVRRANKQLRWPQLCYIATKVGWPLYMGVTFAVLSPITRNNCDALTMTSEALMGLITSFCSALLAFRALCVFQAGRPRQTISAILLVAWVGTLGMWCVGVMDIRADWVPGVGQPWVTPDQGACVFREYNPVRYSIKYLCTVGFDALVLILTVIGVYRTGAKSRLGTVLVEQGILYFVAVLVANTAMLILSLIKLNVVMANCLNPPVQTVHVMVATRLYRDLSMHTGVTSVVSGHRTGATSGTSSGVSSGKFGFRKHARSVGASPNPNSHVISNNSSTGDETFLSKSYDQYALSSPQLEKGATSECHDVNNNSLLNMVPDLERGITRQGSDAELDAENASPSPTTPRRSASGSPWITRVDPAGKH